MRGDEPGEPWTRAHARDRTRGRLEAEGDLKSPCRSLQQRRIPARSDRARRARPTLHWCSMPTEQCRGGAPRAHRGSRRKDARVFMTGEEACRARAGSVRCRCGVSDPELLRTGDPPGPKPGHQRGPAAPLAKSHANQMTGSGLYAIAADHVFDGAVVRERTAVVMDGARILDLVPTTDLPRTTSIRAMPEGAWLAPGFIDLQVNGGGDVLFNDQPSAQSARTIAAAHRRRGTTGLLPTLISDSTEKMRLALEAVNAVVGSEPGILGLHLEGPYLSSEKPGVHDRRQLRQPSPDELAMLTAPRDGVLLVTLAPEIVPAEFIAQLVSFRHSRVAGSLHGIVPADPCGHGRGAYGLHPSLQYDAPLVQPGGRTQSRRHWNRLTPGMGLSSMGCTSTPPCSASHCATRAPDARERCDAARRRTSFEFRLHGDTIAVRDGYCVRDDGTLAGTVLDMAAAVKNCVRLVGVPLPDALRFASTHPATFLGLGQTLGRLVPRISRRSCGLRRHRYDGAGHLGCWTRGYLLGFVNSVSHRSRPGTQFV